MSGRKELPPDDFLLSLGLIGVSDSNSGLEDRRRSIMDSLIDFGNSFGLVFLLLVLGEDTTELFGDIDACPESGSVVDGWRKFGLKVDLSVTISSARIRGAHIAPSFV